MESCGDTLAERLVAGDSDRSGDMSSGDACGEEGADENESMFWANITSAEVSSDII